MSAPLVVDTRMHGFEGITAVYVVRGTSATALVETGPRSSLAAVVPALEASGVETIDWLVLTHIHLDHAGAAGTLARRYPGARVAVHPVGAPHLVDPSKLWKSAARIYGDAMETLWGGIDPLDPDRVVALSDGDSVDLGDRRLVAVESPGHASHHHAYLDDSSGDLFTGDALGVRLQDVAIVRPATPPPEFDLEQAIASIRRLRDSEPTKLRFTHFGTHETEVPPAQLCDEAVAGLRKWDEWVVAARAETSDLDRATAIVRERWRAHAWSLPDEVSARLEQTTSTWMNTWGYMRYHDKRTAPAG